MMPTPHCPECGARVPEDLTCQDHFYQMLYWENEFPGHGVVHHLAVLCYYLQHPSFYSPEGLQAGLGLLVDFVERGETPQHSRQRNRERVSSGQRSWKITARPGSRGVYAHPIVWRMTAADVTGAGAEKYIVSVRQWAASMLEDLRASGNLGGGAPAVETAARIAKPHFVRLKKAG